MEENNPGLPNEIWEVILSWVLFKPGNVRVRFTCRVFNDIITLLLRGKKESELVKIGTMKERSTKFITQRLKNLQATDDNDKTPQRIHCLVWRLQLTKTNFLKHQEDKRGIKSTIKKFMERNGVAGSIRFTGNFTDTKFLFDVELHTTVALQSKLITEMLRTFSMAIIDFNSIPRALIKDHFHINKNQGDYTLDGLSDGTDMMYDDRISRFKSFPWDPYSTTLLYETLTDVSSSSSKVSDLRDEVEALREEIKQLKSNQGGSVGGAGGEEPRKELRNKDSKGNTRGICEDNKCETGGCSEFDRGIKGDGNDCAYCGCPARRHKKL